MNIKEWFAWIPAMFAFVSLFIEIIPVKWCPLSSLAKWLGKKMNMEVITKIDAQSVRLDEFEKKLNSMENDSDVRRIKELRFKILAFSDGIRGGEKRSQKSYEHMFELHDEYVALLGKKDMRNGVMDEAFALIKESYRSENFR